MSRLLTVQDLSKWGLTCPMCGSKTFNTCYHDHQILDSYICRKCGVRWKEDYSRPKGDTVAAWKKWVKDILYYRQHKPLKEGMYKGIPCGGFVWVLHKVGRRDYVEDPRSADCEPDYKKFGSVYDQFMGKYGQEMPAKLKKDIEKWKVTKEI